MRQRTSLRDRRPFGIEDVKMFCVSETILVTQGIFVKALKPGAEPALCARQFKVIDRSVELATESPAAVTCIR